MTKYDQAEPSTDKYGPSTTKYDQVRKRRTKYGPSMDQVRTKYGQVRTSTDKYGQVPTSTDKYGQLQTSTDTLEQEKTMKICFPFSQWIPGQTRQ